MNDVLLQRNRVMVSDNIVLHITLDTVHCLRYIYDVSGVVPIPTFKRGDITVVLQFKWRGLESNPGHFDNLANAVTAGSLGHFNSLNIFQCKAEA
jgi:hypothetical protein